MPGWLHAAIALRGLLQPLIDRQAKIAVPEVDAAFERDVAERGAAAVSRRSAPAARPIRSWVNRSARSPNRSPPTARGP